jgi:3-hydroxyacyl-CoA dehydrogenase
VTTLTNLVNYGVEEGVAVLAIDNPPVNPLSQGVRQGLKDGVEKALSDETVKAILIYCEGRTFIAGADITEFAGGPLEPSLHTVFDEIDLAGKPVVAAIHGTALGGGLETALSCHYRVAVADAKFGLPEVNLGLLPGAGGTQRLPRVIGVEKAIEMITSGKPIGSEEALAFGLIDRIVEGNLRQAGLDFAKQKVAEGIAPADLPRIRNREDKLQAARDNPEIFAAARKTLAKRARGFLAPEYNIRCIEAAVNNPFEEGRKIEAKLFMELMKGPQAAAQQYFFFSERQASKIPNIPKDTPEIAIASVGVIGAGTMGGGIAMNMANVGIPVTIVETSQEALDRGLGIIRKNYENTAKKGRISETDVEARCALIKGSLAMEDLADCDLVIEAVFENMAVKRDIFGRLDDIVKDGAILASNTSALDLNEIASVTKRPESVIGLHFFSPANVMALLEVVRGDKTSNEVVKTAMSFAKRIKKKAVLVGVCYGFVGNRILFVRQEEAVRVAMEGASVAQVDKALYDFGFPMGAFQLSDLAGIDIGWDEKSSNGATVNDRLCELGRKGQKSGSGFYDYDEKRRPTPSSLVADLFAEYAEKEGIARREIDNEEVLERLLLPMINEGAKILDEGIAVRASDIDVVYVYGYGWPVYRGGPMHYANGLGLDKVVERLRHYQEKTGDAFWEPCSYLVSLAEKGERFQ